MSCLMERLPCTCWLIFYCFTFFCVYGRGQDMSPLCEVELKVRRGTTWKVAPQQRLIVKCPVKHCGESLNVTWCKLLDKCEGIIYTDNVEIGQSDKHVRDELISFLTFKQISIHDGGLYRCYIKGHKYEQISHAINISVSDLYQGVTKSDDDADLYQGIPKSDDDADELPNKNVNWLPYFTIFACISLLVAVLTALTLLIFHGLKRSRTNNNTRGQDMSPHMTPDLPQESAPSTLFLQTNFSFQNEVHSPSTAERPPLQPPLMTSGNQPAVVTTADENQASDRVSYAAIKHRQSGIIPVREQHTATKQN